MLIKSLHAKYFRFVTQKVYPAGCSCMPFIVTVIIQ